MTQASESSALFSIGPALSSIGPLICRCVAWKDLRRVIGTLGLAGGMLLNVPAYSSPDWHWALGFGSSGTNIAEAVKIDRAGNSYVTGAFSATAQFQARPASAGKSLTSAGGTDGFLAKYDRWGTLKWLIQIGGAEDDEGYDVAFDADCNVYVAGYFTDSATFQGSHGSGRTVVTGSGQTMFLAKYTSSGALAWIQTGTASNALNSGYGVAVEPVTGSVYMVGVSQGGVTFSSFNGATNGVPGTYFWHMVLVKYDTAGNFQWGITNSASPNSVGKKVAVDADDNAYVTGWMEGQVVFNSIDGNEVTVNGFSGPVQSAPDYPGDGFVAKYDENGNVRWVNHIGGYKAIANDIATSRYGRVSITGLIGNIGDSPSQAVTIVSSQPGASNFNLGGGHLTQPYNKDVFLATFDEDGVLLEARRFGGTNDEGGSGIAYDRRGNLILAGIFQGTIRIAGKNVTGENAYDLFIAKFSRDEVSCVAGFAEHGVEWVAQAGGLYGSDFEDDPRIGLTKQGDVMAAGSFLPPAQFGSIKLEGTGVQDGVLAFLNAHEDPPDGR
jgi:hypothetical protein